MKTLDEINRAINRLLRGTNQVAVAVAASPLTNRAAALREIAEALTRIDGVQRILIAEEPNLEYHFDSERKATPAMIRVAELIDSADKCLESGRFDEAAEILQRACDLEPPVLVYETLAKRLEEVRDKARAK